MTARPNFMIIGAPKCGTSALCSWLDQHPNVFVSKPKEPFYFAADIEHPRRIARESDYLDLFSEADRSHSAVGEASTLYLFSAVAIERIEQRFAGMKYVVMVRDPLEMCISWHNHLLRVDYEVESDLIAALDLEAIRGRGERIPMLCPDPAFVNYRSVCDLGRQLERLYAQVDRERVLVLRLEDLVSSTEQKLRDLLAFLNLDEEKTVMRFQPENAATGPRFRAIDAVLRPLRRVRKAILPGAKGLGLLNAVARMNQRFGRSAIPDAEQRLRLEQRFTGHRQRLAESLRA